MKKSKNKNIDNQASLEQPIASNLNDQTTTAAGNSSSLGEPHHNRDTPHQVTPSSQQRSQNPRKPVKAVPPRSTTYQELLMSYNSDNGTIPVQGKGLESHGLQALMHQQMHGAAPSRGDDDEETKNSIMQFDENDSDENNGRMDLKKRNTLQQQQKVGMILGELQNTEDGKSDQMIFPEQIQEMSSKSGTGFDQTEITNNPHEDSQSQVYKNILMSQSNDQPIQPSLLQDHESPDSLLSNLQKQGTIISTIQKVDQMIQYEQPNIEPFTISQHQLQQISDNAFTDFTSNEVQQNSTQEQQEQQLIHIDKESKQNDDVRIVKKKSDKSLRKQHKQITISKVTEDEHESSDHDEVNSDMKGYSQQDMGDAEVDELKVSQRGSIHERTNPSITDESPQEKSIIHEFQESQEVMQGHFQQKVFNEQKLDELKRSIESAQLHEMKQEQLDVYDHISNQLQMSRSHSGKNKSSIDHSNKVSSHESCQNEDSMRDSLGDDQIMQNPIEEDISVQVQTPQIGENTNQFSPQMMENIESKTSDKNEKNVESSPESLYQLNHSKQLSNSKSPLKIDKPQQSIEMIEKIKAPTLESMVFEEEINVSLKCDNFFGQVNDKDILDSETYNQAAKQNASFFNNVFGIQDNNKKGTAQRYDRQETGSFGTQNFVSFHNATIEVPTKSKYFMGFGYEKKKSLKNEDDSTPMESEMIPLLQNQQNEDEDRQYFNEERKTFSDKYVQQAQQIYTNKRLTIADQDLNLISNRSIANSGAISDQQIDYTELINEYNLNLHTIKTKKLKRKKCQPIEPDSNFKTSWDIIGLFLILYCAVVIPYRVAFSMQSEGFYMFFEYSIDIFFMIDVLINLYTGYYKKGALIMKRRHIMCRYLKTWFILDFVSAIPFAWFIDDSRIYDEDGNLDKNQAIVHHTSQLLRLLKIVRFMRIIRLIRLFKLRRLVNRFEEVFFNDTVSTIMALLKVFFVVFYIVHWAACLFFYMGDLERQLGNPTWITTYGIDKLEPLDQYVASAHWALTTMTTVGYGDLTPISITEMFFGLFSMVLACGVFAFIIGSLSTIIDHKSALILEFKEKILQINDFMIHNKFPIDFRIKVKRYLHYLYDNKKQYKLEEEDVLNMLNDNLRVETTIHLNGKLLNETPIFKSFEVEFLSQLTFVIKKKVFIIDEHIFDEGDKGDSLFYIQKGNIILAHKKTQTFIKELGSDDFMGECAFFTGEPRKASARSKNFTDVITLSKNEFINTTDEFPKALNTYLEIQAEIKNSRDYSKIGVKCYICDKLGHISIDCPEFTKVQGNDIRMFASRDGKLRVSHDPHAHESNKIVKLVSQKTFKEDQYEVKQLTEPLLASPSELRGSRSRENTACFNNEQYFDKEFKSSQREGSMPDKKSDRFSKFMPPPSKTDIHLIEEQSDEHSDEIKGISSKKPLNRRERTFSEQVEGYEESSEDSDAKKGKGNEVKRSTEFDFVKQKSQLGEFEQKKAVQTLNVRNMRPAEQQELFETIQKAKMMRMIKQSSSKRMSQLQIGDEKQSEDVFSNAQKSQKSNISPPDDQSSSTIKEKKRKRSYIFLGNHNTGQETLARKSMLNQNIPRKSNLTASYQLGFQDILSIKNLEDRKGYQPPIDIGKKILDDIGKNIIRRDGGNFMDLISNAEELKDKNQIGRNKKQNKRESTLRSINDFIQVKNGMSSKNTDRKESHSPNMGTDKDIIDHKHFKEDDYRQSVSNFRKTSVKLQPPKLLSHRPMQSTIVDNKRPSALITKSRDMRMSNLNSNDGNSSPLPFGLAQSHLRDNTLTLNLLNKPHKQRYLKDDE